MFRNKCEAIQQDQIYYGKNNIIETNPPSNERYRPPKSQQQRDVGKSTTRNVAFTNKYVGKKNINTSHTS